VSGWLDGTRRQKAREVERVFAAELEKVDEKERGVLLSALVAASAWTTWEGLRAHQRLGEERSREAMRATLGALLAGQR
jgi:hypothetical protein